MNCGLTNLDALRKHLLPDSLVGETKFDSVLQVIGLGVAGLFESHCNRKLAYVADAEIQFSGNRRHYTLPRYPVAEIESIETKYFDSEDWTDITGSTPYSLNPSNGIIDWGVDLGDPQLQVKITWTGGYWFSVLEPEDEGYPEAGPEGATVLPADLRSAFLLQCELIWAMRDKVGLGLTVAPGEQSGLGNLELSPMVRTMLRGHLRYQLS
jgi:hypothetical protein